MKTLFILLLAFSFSAFGSVPGVPGAQEVCPAGQIPLSNNNLNNIRQVHALTCKTEITLEEYRMCVKEPIWRGGMITTTCDKGRYKGCCYRRWNGNPRADWKLIPCDSIDTRDAWTAFTDLFRR